MSEYDDDKTGLSFLSKALIVLVCLSAALGLFYYFSAKNASKYRLVLDDDRLVVEKGWFFPIGMGQYSPEDKRFQSAYEPIELPKGTNPPPVEATYHELAEVDAALLDYVLEVAKDLVAKGKPESFETALKLLERVDRLPALSQAQRQKLKDTRADVYYAQGKLILQKVADELRTVLEHFRDAKRSSGSTGKYRDIDHWIALLESKIRYIESGESSLPAQQAQSIPSAQAENMRSNVFQNARPVAPSPQPGTGPRSGLKLPPVKKSMVPQVPAKAEQGRSQKKNENKEQVEPGPKNNTQSL